MTCWLPGRGPTFALARQAAHSGAVPVLDFGFWTPQMRREAIDALPGCELEWIYLDVPQEEWAQRIAKRNAAISAGSADPSDYYVDEGLLAKVNALFVPPTSRELPGLKIIRG